MKDWFYTKIKYKTFEDAVLLQEDGKADANLCIDEELGDKVNGPKWPKHLSSMLFQAMAVIQR